MISLTAICHIANIRLKGPIFPLSVKESGSPSIHRGRYKRTCLQCSHKHGDEVPRGYRWVNLLCKQEEKEEESFDAFFI